MYPNEADNWHAWSHGQYFSIHHVEVSVNVPLSEWKNPEAAVRGCLLKKGSWKLENFAKFTGKHLHWSLSLLELQVSGVFNWILQNFKNTYFVKTMFIWIQLNNFSNSNLITSIIFAHIIGNASYHENTTFYQKQSPRGV